MILKEQIQKDFVMAMKAKDENAKAALSSVKAKITEAEKANGNRELDNDGVTKVLIKAIKQREESLAVYQSAGRDVLAQREADEANVLRKYMPSQMTETELNAALIQIMQGLAGVATNPNALKGRTIGEFNKKYSGRADMEVVKAALDKLVGL